LLVSLINFAYIVYMFSLHPSFLVPGSRVAVVGSRNFPSPGLVSQFVSGLPAGVVVVSGAGGAVDLAAAAAGRACGLQVVEFPAQWAVYGRAAGPVRNQQLVAAGLSCLVAFVSDPGRLSPGTASVVRFARSAGVPVFFYS
jgi:hypothetical protein